MARLFFYFWTSVTLLLTDQIARECEVWWDKKPGDILVSAIGCAVLAFVVLSTGCTLFTGNLRLFRRFCAFYCITLVAVLTFLPKPDPLAEVERTVHVSMSKGQAQVALCRAYRTTLLDLNYSTPSSAEPNAIYYNWDGCRGVYIKYNAGRVAKVTIHWD